jgi:acyl-phosphate glycerol 3-phosphate acyltransferase
MFAIFFAEPFILWYHPAMPFVILAATLLTAYLIGAIPFGFLIARWHGVDIRKQGSGNIGATNVGRVLGRRLGVLVFLLDFAKGAGPCLAAGWIAGQTETTLPADSLGVSAGLAAILGHLFPIYLQFRGGKGVATGAGVVAVLLPGPALAALLAWVAMLCAFRYVSLASLTAATALCAVRLAVVSVPFGPDHAILSVFCLVTVALVFLRHRSNLSRLVHGTENRLQDSPAMLQLTKLIHVLAVGLWFGMVAFWTFAPLAIFQSFESLATKPAAERPSWLPDSFQKKDGTQLAGLAVGPVFPWYYLVQGACAVLALLTAWPWSESNTRIHRWRFIVLTLALVSVVVAWPIANKVIDLRPARYDPDSAKAASADAEFLKWHGYSLMANFVTLGLVTAAMALASRMPSPVSASVETKKIPLETTAAS